MKSGKRVIGVIIVSLLLIVSIGLVSAGIKDWFGFGDKSEDLEGELPETAVARLKISDTSVPNITYVSNVTGNGPDTGGLNLVKLKPRGADTLVSFFFIAQQGLSGNGPGDLSLPGTNSRVNFTRTGELNRGNSSCNYMGIVSCGGGVYCAGTGTAANFSCTVPMKYYDGNGTWNMNVSVKASSPGYGYNTTKTFDIAATFAAEALTNYLNWTTPPLTTASVNALSDNNITVQNNGNVPYLGVVVNATDLNGTITPSQYIPSSRFNGNGCFAGSSVLIKDNDVPISGFTALRAVADIGMTTNLTFCVTSLSGTPTPLSSQDYNSSRTWVLTLDDS